MADPVCLGQPRADGGDSVARLKTALTDRYEIQQELGAGDMATASVVGGFVEDKHEHGQDRIDH